MSLPVSQFRVACRDPTAVVAAAVQGALGIQAAHYLGRLGTHQQQHGQAPQRLQPERVTFCCSTTLYTAHCRRWQPALSGSAACHASASWCPCATRATGAPERVTTALCTPADTHTHTTSHFQGQQDCPLWAGLWLAGTTPVPAGNPHLCLSHNSTVPTLSTSRQGFLNTCASQHCSRHQKTTVPAGSFSAAHICMRKACLASLNQTTA